jgi:hypothetical protein
MDVISGEYPQQERAGHGIHTGPHVREKAGQLFSGGASAQCGGLRAEAARNGVCKIEIVFRAKIDHLAQHWIKNIVVILLAVNFLAALLPF